MDFWHHYFLFYVNLFKADILQYAFLRPNIGKKHKMQTEIIADL